MIKVAIDSGPLKSGDSVRGIGFHTKLLTEHMTKVKDVRFDIVDVRKENLDSYDLIHYQKFHPYFLSIPLTKKKKSVITIHDLIYLLYPDKYPSGIRGRIIYEMQKILVKRMDAIITISETSKKDIVRFLGIPAEKIFPVHLAARDTFKVITNQKYLDSVKKKYALPEKFVLYVGDVNCNKNLPTLCKAVKAAKTTLVIVGKQAVSKDFDKNHPENKSLVKLLKEYGNDSSIKRLGFVDDEDLVALYNLATVYVQPSFYEGFGLPLLEAFACKLPVIASKIQAHVEIGGEAPLYVDPKKYEDFSEKIRMVMNDEKLRKDMISKGLDKVSEYSWDKTANETAEVYRKITQ